MIFIHSSVHTSIHPSIPPSVAELAGGAGIGGEDGKQDWVESKGIVWLLEPKASQKQAALHIPIKY